MIIRSPGYEKVREKGHGAHGIRDLYPTFAELAGLGDEVPRPSGAIIGTS